MGRLYLEANSCRPASTCDPEVKVSGRRFNECVLVTPLLVAMLQPGECGETGAL